MYKVGMNY